MKLYRRISLISGVVLILLLTCWLVYKSNTLNIIGGADLIMIDLYLFRGIPMIFMTAGVSLILNATNLYVFKSITLKKTIIILFVSSLFSIILCYVILSLLF